MNKSRWLLIYVAIVVIPIVVLLGVWQVKLSALSGFDHLIVDKEEFGVRAAGDINGDGFQDIVVRVENSSIRLVWYEYPDWEQHSISDINNFRSDDIEVADIDGDGYVDVVAVLEEPGQIYWYENPLVDGGLNDLWESHYIGLTDGGSDNNYVKDIELDDFDGDGSLDVVARTHKSVFVFLQNIPISWSDPSEIEIQGHEGMDVADLDGDNDPDIVLNGFWLETPDDPINGIWLEHNIDSKWWNQSTGSWMDNNSKVHTADINADGRMDVLIAHSEKPGYPISWYEASNPVEGPWTEHVVAMMDYCHTLKAADMDNDGDLDILAAEMVKSDDPDEVTVFINEKDGLNWSANPIALTGSYSGDLSDIDNDGDIDIIGGRDWESPPLEIWLNNLNQSWSYIQIGDSREARAFGLAMGDLTNDGYADIVSGPYFYRNPGGDMTGSWNRITLPFDIEDVEDFVDAQLIVDVDDDELADVIALHLPNVYWLEAKDEQGNGWTITKIGELDPNSHVNGQGYALAQIIPGGKPEFILPGDINSLYYFEIPTNPESGLWSKVQITDSANEEGIGTGDIDGDGFVDIAAGYDGVDGYGASWWRNPGDGSENWEQYNVGSTENLPDRFAVADINNDGRLDIVVSEETTLDNASVYWFEQPEDTLDSSWSSHTITTQYTTNSMDVADMNDDGNIDIITGEHRGTEEVTIWINDGNGKNWTKEIVSTGRESHLGARVFDLDGNGDLEIISIAWDDFQYLHMWRKDSEVSVTEPNFLTFLPSLILSTSP